MNTNKELELASVGSSKEFLMIAYELACRAKGTKPSFASLARKGGFSSRAHVREILLGKKMIKENSFKGIVKALCLNHKQGDFLRGLIDLEKLPHGVETEKRNTALKKIETRRNRLNWQQKQWQENGSTTGIPQFLKEKDWTKVYAALGSQNYPETLQSLVKISKISPQKTTSILRSMVEENVCTEIKTLSNEPGYAANFSSLMADKLENFNLAKNLFISNLDDIKKVAGDDFQNPLHLFQTISFKVKKSEVPILRLKLAKLLEQYISDSDQIDGDDVATLSAALTT